MYSPKEAAGEATQQVIDFCREYHSRDEVDRHMREMYADSMCWRGAFLTFGARDSTGRELLKAMEAAYKLIGCGEGITAVQDMLPHVS